MLFLIGKPQYFQMYKVFTFWDENAFFELMSSFKHFYFQHFLRPVTKSTFY